MGDTTFVAISMQNMIIDLMFFSEKPKMLHGSVLLFATTAYEQWTSKETWNR